MKKIIAIMAVVATCFVACKKPDVIVPQLPKVLAVTFKPDSSVVDQTIQPPKNSQLLFSGIFNTGSLNAFGLTNVKVTFKQGGDATYPFTYLRKIYGTVEGGPSTKMLEMKDSVFSNEFSFSSFVYNIPQYQTRTIHIYGDILSTATNHSGAEDNLVVSVQLTYTGYEGNNSTIAYFQIGNVDGHKTIFGTTPQSFAVTSIADPAIPASGIILHGQDKDVFSYGVKLTGLSGSVTEHRFLVGGPAAGAISKLRLFDGANNFIAQANVSGGVATIVTNDAVSAGLQKAYSVKPVVDVTSGDVSNSDFTVTLDAVKAVSTANEQKTDGTDRAANPFTVFKSSMTVSQVPLPAVPIIDSVWMNAYRWNETASVFGPMATKNRCFGVLFVDNGVQDTLQLVPEIWKGSTNVTSSFYLVNQIGDTVKYLVKSDTKLYLVSKTGGNGGETITPAGLTDGYTLRFLPRGFKHSGDGYAVAPVFSQTRLSPDFKFIVGTLGSFAKMSTERSGNSNAQVKPWIVSDFSSPSQSALLNLSSNDWLELLGSLPEQVYSQ